VYGDKVTQPMLDVRMILAVAQVNEGQVEAGLHELDALIPANVALLGESHPQVAVTASFVGASKLVAGDVPGAIAAFQQQLTVEEQIGGADLAFRRGRARMNLAGAYAAARQPVQALPLLDQALQLLKSSVGSEHPLTTRAMSMHAAQLAEAGQFDAADSEFKALATVKWNEPYLAAHQSRLAVFRGLQGRHKDAVALAQRANEITKQIGRNDLHRRSLTLLGTARLDSGDADGALQPLRDSAELFMRSQVRVSPDHAEAMVALGRAQMQLGDVNAAVLSLSVADHFWQAFDAKNRHAGLTKLYVAQAWWAQGNKRGAMEALRQADAVLANSVFAADAVLLQVVRQRFAS
jgi:tetratricopeptide (TPR) repeat protein